MADSLINRIGKLISLAENDGATEAERDRAFTKALALANANSIDLSVARAAQRDKEKVEVPEERSIKVGAYNARTNKWLVDLFLTIARANDARTLIGGANIYVFPIGFPSDLDVIEKLYTHLVVQMIEGANAALKRGEQKTAGRYGDPVDGRIYRANFYEGFIARINGRLWEAKQAAREAYDDATGEEAAAGTAVALRSKTEEIEKTFEANYGGKKLGTYRGAEVSRTAGAAIDHGQSAGARASLGDDSHGVSSAPTRTAIG